MNWMIRNCKNHDEFWNNATGWGSKATADRFTQKERRSLNPPIDGKWVTDSWSFEAIPNDDNRINIQPMNFEVIVSGGRQNDEGENYFEEEELEAIRMMTASPELIEACEVALDYIGDDEGVCTVCGGGEAGLDYHKECPCKKIRKALAKAKGEQDG